MKISSRLHAATAGTLGLLLVCGCAGPRPGGEEARNDEPRRIDVALPGQDRMLPSADPKNAPTDPGGPIGSLEGRGPQSAEPAQPAPSVGQGGAKETFFQVQVLATGDRQKAGQLRDRLSERLELPVSVEHQLGVWKVRVGRVPDRAAAEALRHRLAGIGYQDAFVVVGESR